MSIEGCIFFGWFALALGVSLFALCTVDAKYLYKVWCKNCNQYQFTWEWKGRQRRDSGAKCSECGCRNTLKENPQ